MSIVVNRMIPTNNNECIAENAKVSATDALELKRQATNIHSDD